ncbi:MAG: hypothetical protein IJC87_02870 [Clostridia bacterium]|nr:hypothetical protein [Clostridia bacterium]
MAKKYLVAKEKSEKFFFEGHIRVGYNKSILPELCSLKEHIKNSREDI